MASFLVFHGIQDIRLRPDFDENELIELNEFEKLIGSCEFSDDAVCQIKTEKGRCGQHYQHGWLVKKKNGKEVLVGCICANTHFGADNAFKHEKARVNEIIQIDQLNKKIDAHLENGIEKKVEALRSEAIELRKKIDSLKAKIPDPVQEKIKETNKLIRRNIYIEVGVLEKDDHGKQKTKWSTEVAGSLRPSNFLDTKDLLNVIGICKCINLKIAQAKEKTVDTPKKQLKIIADELDKIGDCQKTVDRYSSEYVAFTEKDNLSLLLLVTSKQEEKRQLAEMIDDLCEIENFTADKFIKEYAAATRKKFNDHDFRAHR